MALAEPVLAGRLTCSEQPQGILTALLMPYLRTGRLRRRPRDAHRQAYRRLRAQPGRPVGRSAEHVEFCALTGNEARGLEIVERHLGWLDRAPSPAAAMRFAAAAALLLRRVAEAEPTARAPAGRRRPAGRRVPAAALAAELAGTATGAGRPVRRPQRHRRTSREWIARRLAAGPVGEHLPLSASLRRTVGRPRRGHPQPDATAGAEAPVSARPRPAADELLDLAERVPGVPTAGTGWSPCCARTTSGSATPSSPAARGAAGWSCGRAS